MCEEIAKLFGQSKDS